MQSQVIICDQQSVYAMGSALLINSHPEYFNTEIISELAHLNELLQSQLPQVLVLDSELFDFSCKEQIEHLKSLLKKMPIMVVINDHDNLLLFQLIDHDFTVIVSRNVTKEEWIKGLEMAKMQKVFFSQQIAIRVSALSVSMEDIYLLDKVSGLSAYDKYILIRICEEAPSKQIAFELGNSKRTIEGHRTKMMQLFDVKNVAGLVKIAFTTKLYQHYLSNPGLYSKTLCVKTSSL